MGKTRVLIGVPIDCVGVEGGTEGSATALREAGLGAVVGGRDVGDLPVHIRDRRRDPASGVLGIDDVVAVTRAVRDAVGEVVAAGELPVLVTGDCTAVVGAVAGARSAGGDVALVYLDGHLDLYDGRTSPTGESADMPIAVLIGRGPSAWSAAASERAATNHAQVIGADRICLVGFRDAEEAQSLGSVMPDEVDFALVADREHIGVEGPAAVAGAILAATEGADGVWVHIDVDVLDEAVFPATDYLMPGGLDLDELRELVVPVCRDERLVGLSIACYNPLKDLDGTDAEALVALIDAALNPAGV